jgi:hypothetical protein
MQALSNWWNKKPACAETIFIPVILCMVKEDDYNNYSFMFMIDTFTQPVFAITFGV